MKAVISSVFRKVVSLFRKVGSSFHRISPLFGKVGSLFHRVSPFFSRVRPLFGKVGSLFYRVSPLFSRVRPLLGRPGSPSSKVGSSLRRAGPLFLRVGSLFRKVGSLLNKLIQKLWLLPPGRRIDRALQRTWKRKIPMEYRFLPYLTSVLRVLGWVVLVIGVLASIVLGLEIMDGGLMVSNTELIGVGMGVSAIILGIIGSFLAWLFLLVSRELVYLFIHVKENTRNTAQHFTDESN
ncbi:MAG TPA: hypothetical protein VEG43_04250 [Dehalococcoidia bacterium]|nr:hypothetical protein [Dehalococcoidia bacterium]